MQCRYVLKFQEFKDRSQSLGGPSLCVVRQVAEWPGSFSKMISHRDKWGEHPLSTRSCLFARLSHTNKRLSAKTWWGCESFCTAFADSSLNLRSHIVKSWNVTPDPSYTQPATPLPHLLLSRDSGKWISRHHLPTQDARYPLGMERSDNIFVWAWRWIELEYMGCLA